MIVLVWNGFIKYSIFWFFKNIILGVVSGNPTGLTVKDLAALSYSASAAAANSGANSGGSGAADEDYGDYYEDEGGFGGGVDPVDQSQVGKGKGFLLWDFALLHLSEQYKFD